MGLLQHHLGRLHNPCLSAWCGMPATPTAPALALEVHPDLLVQQLINGLTIGGFYALVALGYTMVYGVLKLINFAHGDLFMWGAYVGWVALTFILGSAFKTGLLAIVPVTVVILVARALLGITIERAPTAHCAPPAGWPPIISALGAAFILESASRNIWGASYKIYPAAAAPRRHRHRRRRPCASPRSSPSWSAASS